MEKQKQDYENFAFAMDCFDACRLAGIANPAAIPAAIEALRVARDAIDAARDNYDYSLMRRAHDALYAALAALKGE